MIRRRDLLAAAGLGLSFAGLPAWGAVKGRRIMLLLYRGETAAEQGFMDYLKLRMPVDFIIRDADGDRQRLAAMVAEARELKPDLIYTFGTTVTAETVGTIGHIDPRRHIVDIPVVFNIVADPLGAALTSKLQASHRNLTGVSHLAPVSAQWQAIQRYGSTKRLAIIYSPNEKNAVLAAAQLARLARDAGCKVSVDGITADAEGKPTEAGLRATLSFALSNRPDWLYLPSDSFLIGHAPDAVGQANAADVPVFAATEEPVRRAGALAGLVSPYYAAGQFAAFKAEQILSGQKKAGEVPIDTLARFTYLINIATARRLKRYPPLDLLRFAEAVGTTA
jgi:putative ABC transport system substrate-binding protein